LSCLERGKNLPFEMPPFEQLARYPPENSDRNLLKEVKVNFNLQTKVDFECCGERKHIVVLQ
jgi:hypothetical protein